MSPFHLYLVATSIFTQVYSLYGANSSIDVTVTEYTITLHWALSNLTANYNVIYGVNGSNTDTKNDTVTIPTSNETMVTHEVSELFPGQTYNVELHMNADVIFNSFITTKPLPVVNVQASSITSTSAAITWLPSNQSIQDKYQLFIRGITNTSFQFESPNTTATEFLVQGLTHSRSYIVAVVAYSHDEPSDPSQELTMNAAPLPPTDVMVVAIDTHTLNITWESQPESTQDSYILSYTYNSSNGDNMNELTVNITCNTSDQRYCVRTMPGIPGQVYEIRVYSKLGVAVSEAAMTLHSTIPLPVNSIEEILSKETSIHLRWTLPDNLDYHFRHFIVHISSAYGSMQWEITGDKLELPLTNLNTGSQYNVSIIVSTGYETSPAVERTFYTYPIQVDSLTNNVYQDTATESFTVFWTINDTATYDNFLIYINPEPENATLPVMLAPDVFNYTFKNLAPGRAYLVTVVTRLSYKESEPVNNTFRTLPNKPADLVVKVKSGSEVKVDWKAPLGNHDDYRLTLTGSDDPKIVTKTGTTYTFIGLVPGMQYILKIESQSAGLYSEAITSTFTTNEADPLAVTGLRVTIVDSHSVTIVWEVPVNSIFDQYEISIDPADVTSPVLLNSNVTDLSYKLTSLTPGQLYTISMTTVSSGVYSESLATRIVTGPLSVIDLQALYYKAGLLVTWKCQNTSKQSGFMVIYQEKPAGVPVHLPIVVSVENQSDYSIEIPDLFPGGTYKVKVQAWQNVSGESAGSSIQETSGTTKPKSVENVTAYLVGTDVIDLDWSAPAESIHSHYVVKHRPSLRNADALWVENSTLSTNLTLPDLFPGERYEIEIYAVSEAVRSDVRMIHVGVAPLPPPSVSVLVEHTSTSSITLQWLYQKTATYVESWIIRYLDDNGMIVNQTAPRPATATIVDAAVNGLVAGFKYNMSVQAVVQDVESSAVTTSAVTKPVNNIIPRFESVPTNSSFVIHYDEPETDYFDEIVFVLTDTKAEIRKPQSDVDKQVEFTSLEAGTLYTVELQTVSGGEKSDSKTINTQTMPNPPTVSSTSTASKITLTIHHPNGGVATYVIQCFSPINEKVMDTTVVAVFDSQTLSIDNLRAYTTYNCDVTSQFGTHRSTTKVTVATTEAPPSVVRNLVAVESAPTEVTLTWTMPEFQNGAISLYVINYIGQKGTDTEEGQANVTFPTAKHMFTALKAGYQYTFHVRALTAAGSSMPSTATLLLKTYKPPYKDGIDEYKAMPKSVDPKIAPSNPYKLVVNFTNVFSDKYGEVIQYTVIVTEDKESNDMTKPFLPGWKVARQDPAIKAYQVISNCSTFFDAGSSCDGQFVVRNKRAVEQTGYKVFEIGSETGCENRFYCNGPLKPDTTYYVTLRAYTTMQYKDTPFSEAVRTAALPVEEDGTNVGGIVGGVIASIAVIAIIIVVIMRRRMDQKSNMYRHQPGEQMTNRSSLTSRKSCCPVALASFNHHIQTMKADSDFKYAEQFEDLKDIGRGQPCSAAELPGNRGKNRFTNILPYDHSRVKLLPIDDEEGSDYINANYIPGYNSRREYCVSQGPLPATRDDFWRLLWEQNCRNIVMLTKCVEKGREKCDKYWPSGSDAVFYGDLQVATLNETLFPDWTVTEFRVSLGDQSRQIRHFHFTSWPDFGVPKKEPVLVRFVRMVREKLIKDAGPILVHCSAGVGRSGTFVVLDRLLQHIKTHDTLDVFSTVAELRKERVWMVQTEQQYICIHNCLLCVLEGREDEHIYDNAGHSNIAFEDDEGVDLN